MEIDVQGVGVHRSDGSIWRLQMEGEMVGETSGIGEQIVRVYLVETSWNL